MPSRNQVMSQRRQSFLCLTRLSRTVAGLSKFLNLTVAGFAGRAVLHCDIESGNLPILSVDEMIEVEQADFAALGGGLLVLDH